MARGAGWVMSGSVGGQSPQPAEEVRQEAAGRQAQLQDPICPALLLASLGRLPLHLGLPPLTPSEARLSSASSREAAPPSSLSSDLLAHPML